MRTTFVRAGASCLLLQLVACSAHGQDATLRPTPAEAALDDLEAHADGKRILTREQTARASATVLEALATTGPRAEPEPEPRVISRLHLRLARLRGTKYMDAYPRAGKPLSEKHPLQRLLLTVQLREMMQVTAAQELPAETVNRSRFRALVPMMWSLTARGRPTIVGRDESSCHTDRYRLGKQGRQL